MDSSEVVGEGMLVSASNPRSMWALTWSAAFLGVILLVLLKMLAFPSKLKLPPGPKGWPIIGVMLGLAGDPQIYRTFATLAKKYGPIMHLKLGGFDTIIISNGKMTEELFKTRDLEFSSRPHDTAGRSAGKYVGLGSDIGFQPFTPKVKLLRNMCKSELLTTAKLNATAEMRSKVVAGMVRNLSTNAQDPQNKILPRVHFLEMMTNVMCSLIFGKTLDGNDLSDDQMILKTYKIVADEMMQLVARVNLCDLFPVLEWVDPQGLQARFKKLNARLKETFGIIIDEHRARRANHEVDDQNEKDFVDMMLDFEAGDKEKFSDLTIMGVLNNLMLGGTETSAATMEWALGELLVQPHLLARLHSEVDNVVGSKRRVAESDISNMPFLNAVVQETLRLHPVLPMMFPHKNEAQCTLGGYDIPAHATLFVNLWAIARDPAVWENPTHYNPDRFLPGGTYSKVKMNGGYYELLPFGAGRRMCVGMNLATVSIQMSLASIVHAFDWTIPDEKNGLVDLLEGGGVVSVMNEPLVAIPRPRDALKNYL